MSELIHSRNHNAIICARLLATVSSLALLTSVQAQASGNDKPTVWIELGAQLERLDGTGDRFTPDFIMLSPTPDPYKPISPLEAEKAPRFAIGGNANISFQPRGTDWVFSAGIRYGRSNGNKHIHKQGYHTETKYFLGQTLHQTQPTPSKFADIKALHKESHSVVDFMAGKDVGLGLFGRGTSAVISGGVRYAQFSTKSDITIRAHPDIDIINAAPLFGFSTQSFYVPRANFHGYTMIAHAERNFHAVGPSASWNVSMPFAGDPDSASFTFDWGINGAVLFGRQKAHTSHQTTGHYYKFALATEGRYTTPTKIPADPKSRSRSVVVPNLGGFAGVSLKFPNAKMSVGYRADMFFGAVDAGIDARNRDTLSFHGPYASISIGLGG